MLTILHQEPGELKQAFTDLRCGWHQPHQRLQAFFENTTEFKVM